jgi:hypothetical protein
MYGENRNADLARNGMAIKARLPNEKEIKFNLGPSQAVADTVHPHNPRNVFQQQAAPLSLMLPPVFNVI